MTQQLLKCACGVRFALRLGALRTAPDSTRHLICCVLPSSPSFAALPACRPFPQEQQSGRPVAYGATNAAAQSGSSGGTSFGAPRPGVLSRFARRVKSKLQGSSSNAAGSSGGGGDLATGAQRGDVTQRMVAGPQPPQGPPHAPAPALHPVAADTTVQSRAQPIPAPTGTSEDLAAGRQPLPLAREPYQHY